MTRLTSSSTETTGYTNLPLTQEMLKEALDGYIQTIHGSDVMKGCGGWYCKMRSFQEQGMKTKKLNQAMYDWATETVAQKKHG